jgi:hypothetical protein
MAEADLVRIFCGRLAEAGIDYMVTGAVASIIYGQPRLTRDIDLVISLGVGQAPRLNHAFGPEEFYCPPLEVIRIEMGQEVAGHFNLIHHASGHKADIYPLGKDPLHRWAFPRRRQVQYGEHRIWVAPPEYVILRKLQYYREGGSDKHLTDIRGMLEVSGELIDRAILEQKIREHSLQAEWESVLKGEAEA